MTPITQEMARAAQERGPLFVKRLPLVMGRFDDGDDVASVVILGSGSSPNTVRTLVPGTTTGIFDVPLAMVTIEQETAQHLELVAGFIAQHDWMQKHPRPSSYRRRNPALH